MGGTPAFTEKGKALGISIIRIPKGGGMMAMRSIQPVILPAEDVMEIAEQAIQSAKEEDEKTESADEEAKDDDDGGHDDDQDDKDGDDGEESDSIKDE